jgi:hypothetical protein
MVAVNRGSRCLSSRRDSLSPLHRHLSRLVRDIHLAFASVSATPVNSQCDGSQTSTVDPSGRASVGNASRGAWASGLAIVATGVSDDGTTTSFVGDGISLMVVIRVLETETFEGGLLSCIRGYKC